MFLKRPIKYVLTGLIALTLCLTVNKICDAQGDGAPAAVRHLRVVNGPGGSPGVTIGHRSIIPTALSLGTVFISTTGSGNACTRTAPCDWKTGIARANPGDVVFFAGGVYFLEVADRRIYLKGLKISVPMPGFLSQAIRRTDLLPPSRQRRMLPIRTISVRSPVLFSATRLPVYPMRRYAHSVIRIPKRSHGTRTVP